MGGWWVENGAWIILCSVYSPSLLVASWLAQISLSCLWEVFRAWDSALYFVSCQFWGTGCVLLSSKAREEGGDNSPPWLTFLVWLLGTILNALCLSPLQLYSAITTFQGREICDLVQFCISPKDIYISYKNVRVRSRSMAYIHSVLSSWRFFLDRDSNQEISLL